MPLILSTDTNPGTAQWVDASTLGGGGNQRTVRGHVYPGIGGFAVDGPSFFDGLTTTALGVSFTGSIDAIPALAAADGLRGFTLQDVESTGEFVLTPIIPLVQIHTRCRLAWTFRVNDADTVATAGIGAVGLSSGVLFIVSPAGPTLFSYSNEGSAFVTVPTTVTVNTTDVYEFAVDIDRTGETPVLTATIRRVVTAGVRTDVMLWTEEFTEDLPSNLATYTTNPAGVFAPVLGGTSDVGTPSVTFAGISYEYTAAY